MTKDIVEAAVKEYTDGLTPEGLALLASVLDALTEAGIGPEHGADALRDIAGFIDRTWSVRQAAELEGETVQ